MTTSIPLNSSSSHSPARFPCLTGLAEVSCDRARPKFTPWLHASPFRIILHFTSLLPSLPNSTASFDPPLGHVINSLNIPLLFSFSRNYLYNCSQHAFL